MGVGHAGLGAYYIPYPTLSLFERCAAKGWRKGTPEGVSYLGKVCLNTVTNPPLAARPLAEQSW